MIEYLCVWQLLNINLIEVKFSDGRIVAGCLYWVKEVYGLSQIIMDMEVECNSAIEKYKNINNMENDFGILLFSISPTLCFDVDTCSTLNQVWTTLVNLF